MRVLCNYTDYGIRRETRESLALWFPETEYVDSTGDPFGYALAIGERWTGDDDLVVIEQDMRLNAAVRPVFEECVEDWCTFGYQVWDFFTYWSLGCTRFSAALQRQFPDIPVVIWSQLDGAIRTMLWDYRMPHCHGAVEHLHEYSSYKLPNLRAKRAKHKEMQGSRTIKETLADWEADPWSWA